MMKKLHTLVLALALALLVVVPARAQGTAAEITLQACQAYLDQYGTPTSDAATTFQGGSIEAQQVAFCQSLSFRAERDGTSFEQAFSALADTNQNGSVDETELNSYFLGARNGEPALASPTVDSARSAATAGPAVNTLPAGAAPAAAAGANGSATGRSVRTPLLLGGTALVVAALGLVGYRVARPRRRV